MKAKYIHCAIFAVVVFIGAVRTLKVVWDFSDTANGLMPIPNLICPLVLSGVTVSRTKNFDNRFLQYEKRRQKKVANN